MAAASTKNIRIAVAAVCLLASVALVWFAWISPALKDPGAIALGQGDYSLQTIDGAPFTEATLEGRPSAVFFGFTHCPEVCPTTLADIALWQDELGAAANDLQFYFVTVDPERDTAEVLGDYVGWVPNVTGVTGSVEEVAKAQTAFRVYSRKIPLSDGEYTMDHSAYVMLFDADGEFVDPIMYQEELDQALAKLNRLLAG